SRSRSASICAAVWRPPSVTIFSRTLTRCSSSSFCARSDDASAVARRATMSSCLRFRPIIPQPRPTPIAAIGTSGPRSIIPPRSTQLLDLASERSVFGSNIAFDVSETPVDVLHPRTDVARSASRRRTHALPELLLLAVDAFQHDRLRWSHHRSNEVEGDDTATAHEHGGKEADPHERDIEAS